MILLAGLYQYVACVTILPNDDAYGMFSFSSDSLTTTLQETQVTATGDNGELIT